MATADEEHFLRSSLLLLKGSLFITKKILIREEQREIQQTGRDIDDLLKSYKQKLEQQFQSYKQRAILFPQNGKTEVEKWDISLLTGVLLIVFHSSLSDDERIAVKHIKYQRNEIYAHTAVASRSVNDYNDICSELKAAYDTLASGFNSDVKEQCSNIVETCLKGPLDLKASLEQLKKMSETDDMFREILTRIDTSGKETTLALTNTLKQESSALKGGISMEISRSENNICNTIRDLQLKKEDLCEIVLNAVRQVQQEKRVKRKVKVVDSELEVSGNETDQPRVDEAEEILLRVTNEAIRRAQTSKENIYIREKIQEILDNIECQTDLKPLTAEKGCVIIRFDCSTYEQLFNLIIYMESKDMKQRLNKLAVSLSCRLNTKDKLHVSFSLSFKTLQSIVEELEANCRREYKRSVRIPIQVESVQGMIRLFEIFEGGGLTNNLNKLSEALTEKVGAKINVKSSININQLKEALEEFDHVRKATMQIDKTEDRSSDKKWKDADHEEDVEIVEAEEKICRRIASDNDDKKEDDGASIVYELKTAVKDTSAVEDINSQTFKTDRSSPPPLPRRDAYKEDEELSIPPITAYDISSDIQPSNETVDEELRAGGREVSKMKGSKGFPVTSSFHGGVRFQVPFPSRVSSRSYRTTNLPASSPSKCRSRASECNESDLTRRSDEKFVEDVRARIDEVSTRESSGCSSEDMEVFKKPMCLVWTEEGNTLKIDDRTVKEINKISWPMIIVAVVGLYRTGKSYLMNLLAGSQDGFDLGNTIQSKTKGIWVWCVIHPQKPNTVLLLIDTQGLGDIEKGDTNHDNKIFSLATLLCNCLVYNMKCAFDQDALSKLTFITEMTKHIRFRKTSSQENEYLSLILPEFILCLRDFSLKLIKDKKTITEDEYLEGSLEEQKGKGDEFNKPRECIKKYFPVRKCFTFPVPGDIEVLEKLETMSFDDLPNRFKEATTRFVSYIYSLKPKELLASKPINGLMFTSLATHYVEAIRHGAIPDVDDAFLATAKIENSRIKDNALKIFEESMAKIILPIPSKNLDDIYTKAQNETLRYLRKNVIHDRDGHFEITTQSAMDTIWHELKRKNTDKIFDLCNEKIQDAFKPLKKNIDKNVYEVAGGHKKFQRDVNRMKDEFMSSLREFKEHEILLTWLGFLETLKATESEIIEADDHLSEQEKEAERKHNEERMKELAKEHEQSKKELIEEQRKLLQNHYDNLQKEREIQLKEEQERYEELLEVKLEKEQMQNEMKRMEKEQKEHKKQLQEERKRYQVLLHVKSEKDKMQREMDRMKKEQKEKKEKGIFSRITDAIYNE